MRSHATGFSESSLRILNCEILIHPPDNKDQTSIQTRDCFTQQVNPDELYAAEVQPLLMKHWQRTPQHANSVGYDDS
eukprot:1095902-Amphidinium_carterae.1